MILAAVCAIKAGAVDVTVGPYSDVRQAIRIDKGPHQETINIKTPTDSDWTVKRSYLITATDTTLWKKTESTERQYKIMNAYSAQEYAIIGGELTKNGHGGGGYNAGPTFSITVPSVDIDWPGHDDEVAEDTYIQMLPLTADSSKWKTVFISPPKDKVSADCTMMIWCNPASTVVRLRETTQKGGQIISHGHTFTPPSGGGYTFVVEPLSPGEFKIILEGTATANKAKARDTIYGCVFEEIKLITPAGDPVNAPKQSGDGQNEFVYSTANPGVLTLNLKASVNPSSILSKIKDSVSFTVDNIPGSTMQWSTQNPNGKASVNNGFLCATVTFTGLPSQNTSFGLKTARVWCDGVEQDKQNYEVFYPKEAKNHPVCSNCQACPNWYYYWKQTPANGANTTMIYVGSGPASGYEYLDNRTIKIGDVAAGTHRVIWGAPKGIDSFAWVTRHEAKHHTQITGFWPTTWESARDANKNLIPDNMEATYMPPRNYNSPNERTYPDEVGYGDNPIRDIEDICMRSQTFPYNLDVLWNNGAADTHDWARPGKQSKDEF